MANNKKKRFPISSVIREMQSKFKMNYTLLQSEWLKLKRSVISNLSDKVVQ